MAARTNSSRAPSCTTQSKPTELQDALQVRKPHLDRLALTSRCFEALGASERPGDVPGALWMLRRMLRDGSFGQHCGLSGHKSQSSLLSPFGPADPHREHWLGG